MVNWLWFIEHSGNWEDSVQIFTCIFQNALKMLIGYFLVYSDVIVLIVPFLFVWQR